MSYGYDSPEYADYSAYNDSYNKYADSYPNHAEHIYSDPDPTHSEPDHYGDHKDAPERYKYEHEGEVEGHELKELRYKDEAAYGDGYEGGFKSTMPKYEATDELVHESEYSMRAN
jgi:hypothetical protein